ncbi:MAG: diaminopimelate decarboxylase [Bacteroidetes bacterium]|nr:diaminopimelate decarboxylase [Bacteroidota bacterium]MBU1114904.1 diaminopimelate decarboxylase [Bacteroidota bacterium]MBU1799386.1 diaminopimelate decarboxylase [Bacteroidota bacterium]
MKHFESDYFTYINDELYCEKVNLNQLAEEFGTPLFVYSKNFFIDRFKELDDAFKLINHKIYFASKANFNLNVIKTFYELGSGVDVNSTGEFYRAIKAGVNPKDILLTGVGKTDEEIALGLEKGVFVIKAESLEEVYVINDIAAELNIIAPLAIRVNPDVDAQTHPYISTGLAENKFGIDSVYAYDMFVECSKLSNIELVGIDMHIGSQITKIEPFIEATLKMAELFKKIKAAGIPLKHFDIGGGIGVLYNDETPFTPKELAEKLIPIFMQLDAQIMFEPGRFLTANGGVLLTNVLYTKTNSGGKNFIVVDSSMTELLRPSLYKSYHHVQPIENIDNIDFEADIVGPVCETGDYIAKEREITMVGRGDKLAIMSAGAYGMAMSSNYNGRRRPAEILVDGSEYKVIRSRETFRHLIFDEEALL